MEIKSSADFVRMTRAALAAAGFVRNEIDGTVYFSSTPVIPSGARDPGGRGAMLVPAAPPAQVPRSARDDVGAIVLIHGVNDHAGSWFSIAPTLARTHRVLIPDLPGHGESAPKAGPLPISMLVARLQALIPDEPVTLVGNSLGGWLAMLYTLAHPERVARLVLEASGGLNLPFDSPTVARNRDEAMIILRKVHGPKFEPPEWVIEALLLRANDSPMLRVTEIAEHYVDRRLGEISAPTTIVWGADDGVVPWTYTAALKNGIPHATLHVIEGAAHIPHMQQPERFLACLTSTS